MVGNAPTEETIIDDLLDFITGDPLVAHNIHFDEKFLLNLCSRYDREFRENRKYDTLQLARSLYYEQPVFNLSALSEFFGLSSKGAHRAEVRAGARHARRTAHAPRGTRDAQHARRSVRAPHASRATHVSRATRGGRCGVSR